MNSPIFRMKKHRSQVGKSPNTGEKCPDSEPVNGDKCFLKRYWVFWSEILHVIFVENPCLHPHLQVIQVYCPPRLQAMKCNYFDSSPFTGDFCDFTSPFTGCCGCEKSPFTGFRFGVVPLHIPIYRELFACTILFPCNIQWKIPIYRMLPVSWNSTCISIKRCQQRQEGKALLQLNKWLWVSSPFTGRITWIQHSRISILHKHPRLQGRKCMLHNLFLFLTPMIVYITLPRKKSYPHCLYLAK